MGQVIEVRQNPEHGEFDVIQVRFNPNDKPLPL